ncbi:MAG: ABC transporter ATP-binding protein [Planctomycetes bacterium]|nr:ABC transporter ATP-binding protein [Planctomycetota bacterium]
MPDLASSIPALACRGVSKSFGSNRALDAAELSVAAGSIHALVGENGAGKSTLMNIVSGLLRPDAGSVEVFGAAARFASPLDAVAAGVGMVHQHFLLAEAFTVAENVALGRRASSLGLRFDSKRYEAEVEKLSEETGLSVDPRARVEDLSVGLRQRVEILKALARGARILLLDEPTAVLAPPEVQALFTTLERLRAAGRTIVLITHKLDEVFALASDVTVLRRGKTVFAGPLTGFTAEDLARKMVGEAREINAERPVSGGEIILEAKALSVPAASGTGLHDAAFALCTGEILGIAGVEGNGQDELAGAIAGTLRPAPGAQLRLAGADLLAMNIRRRAEAGIAYIPSDRQREGLVLEFSLAENLILREAFARPNPFGRGPLIDRHRVSAMAGPKLADYEVRPPDPVLPAGSLSGGNQQKVVIARELSRHPKVILACNPTRGLDVAAAASVHARLLDAARKDRAAVLLISSDLDEVLRLSDRVAVLYNGRLKEAGVRGVGKEEIGRAMVGA